MFRNNMEIIIDLLGKFWPLEKSCSSRTHRVVLTLGQNKGKAKSKTEKGKENNRIRGLLKTWEISKAYFV